MIWVSGVSRQAFWEAAQWADLCYSQLHHPNTAQKEKNFSLVLRTLCSLGPGKCSQRAQTLRSWKKGSFSSHEGQSYLQTCWLILSIPGQWGQKSFPRQLPKVGRKHKKQNRAAGLRAQHFSFAQRSDFVHFNPQQFCSLRDLSDLRQPDICDQHE